MIQRGEWGPKGKRQPQVLTCLIQLLNASLLLESTRSMGITPPAPPTWAVEREENREGKKVPQDRASNREAGRNARKWQEKGKSSVSLFNPIFHCLEKLAEDVCAGSTERDTRWSSAALGIPVLWDLTRQATYCVRAGTALVGPRVTGTLLLQISSQNPNHGTPEEGVRLPGQALLFASTHHSTSSLRTRRCRVKG